MIKTSHAAALLSWMSPFMWRKVFMALCKGGTTRGFLLHWCIKAGFFLRANTAYANFHFSPILVGSVFFMFSFTLRLPLCISPGWSPPRPLRPSSRSAPLHPECANVFGCVCVACSSSVRHFPNDLTSIYDQTRWDREKRNLWIWKCIKDVMILERLLSVFPLSFSFTFPLPSYPFQSRNIKQENKKTRNQVR